MNSFSSTVGRDKEDSGYSVPQRDRISHHIPTVTRDDNRRARRLTHTHQLHTTGGDRGGGGFKRKHEGQHARLAVELRLPELGAAAAARGEAARSRLGSTLFLLGLTRHAHCFSCLKESQGHPKDSPRRWVAPIYRRGSCSQWSDLPLCTRVQAELWCGRSSSTSPRAKCPLPTAHAESISTRR